MPPFSQFAQKTTFLPFRRLTLETDISPATDISPITDMSRQWRLAERASLRRKVQQLHESRRRRGQTRVTAVPWPQVGRLHRIDRSPRVASKRLAPPGRGNAHAQGHTVPDGPPSPSWRPFEAMRAGGVSRKGPEPGERMSRSGPTDKSDIPPTSIWGTGRDQTDPFQGSERASEGVTGRVEC